MKLRRLTQGGFAHHIVIPVLVIIGVAAVGIHVLGDDSAQTLNCTQLSGTFRHSANPTVPYNKDGTSNGATYHCVQYIQQMLNGAYGYLIATEASASGINATPTQKLLGKTVFDVKGGFASISDVYDTPTQNEMQYYQAGVNLSTDKKYLPSAYVSKGGIPTSGVTESKTWYSLCEFMNTIPIAERTVANSTDFNSSTGLKTNMWYLRSYMRAGYSAYDSAGCKVTLGTAIRTTNSNNS